MWNIWKTKEDYETHLKENGLEEKVMAKKKKIVEFMKTDGLEPRREFGDNGGRPFLLRMPFTVAEQVGRRVRLGLSCNLPCVVVRSGKAELFAPGQELEVGVDIGYGEGEVVAKCYPIDCSNLELSDG